MALGLAMVVLLAGRSMVKALLAMLVGLWLAGIGTDLFSQTSRFTFGQMELLSGIDFVVVAIGVFAMGEVLANMEKARRPQALPVPKDGATPADPAGLEGLALRLRQRLGRGFLIGVLPGAGSTIASFILRAGEGSVAPSRAVRQGVVEGAAPGGANNAETGGALIPMLTLGIPAPPPPRSCSPRLVLWGFKPGPFHSGEPGAVLGPVASMYVGNLMLLVLNLPLVPLFAQVLRAPVYAFPGDLRHFARRRLQRLRKSSGCWPVSAFSAT